MTILKRLQNIPDEVIEKEVEIAKEQLRKGNIFMIWPDNCDPIYLDSLELLCDLMRNEYREEIPLAIHIHNFLAHCEPCHADLDI